MNRVITTETIAEILGKSRTQKGKSQREMAKKMSKSIGTIQNWEYGLSSPTIIEIMEWFEILGLNPLRYILEFLHPNIYNNTESQRERMSHWINEIATDNEIEKLSYSIYGSTGSSWSCQVEELCALNHLPIIDRINIAENVSTLYKLKKARNELRNPDIAQPNIDDLDKAINHCKQAVLDGKDDYSIT